MTDAKIILNGQEFPIHYRMLQVIAEDFPAQRQYMELAKAFIGLNIPSITAAIIENVEMDREVMDAIWENGDIDIRRNLLQNDAFRQNLTDAQAREIIDANDEVMLEMIAATCEEFYPDEDGNGMRLSGQMADKLMECIIKSPTASVRGALINNSRTPTRFLPSLREFVEIGGSYCSSGVIAAIKKEDVPFLATCSQGILKRIANSVEDIEDRGARRAVVEFIAAHPDPAVRLELAENSCAPNYAHHLLLADQDEDVVWTAQKALDEDQD